MSQKITLKRKEEIANGTMAFYFDKPEGFEYRAGQNADFTLIDPSETDEEGNKRTFSFITKPSDEEIAIATRLRDTAFKRVLRDLSEGSELEMDGPYGDYTLHKTESTPAVFLIGGIGVTPVRSMVADATEKKTDHKITLFHANKTMEDAPFADDFRVLSEENPNFDFVPVVDEASDGFEGEVGHIDAEMVKRHVEAVISPIYYLSGPVGMVKAMRELLVVSFGVSEDNIRTEEFSGY